MEHGARRLDATMRSMAGVLRCRAPATVAPMA
jgi:hypothetical protein